MSIVHSEIQMMKRMVSWSIDEVLQEMTSDHIGIMDLAGESKSRVEYMQDEMGCSQI